MTDFHDYKAAYQKVMKGEVDNFNLMSDAFTEKSRIDFLNTMDFVRTEFDKMPQQRIQSRLIPAPDQRAKATYGPDISDTSVLGAIFHTSGLSSWFYTISEKFIYKDKDENWDFNAWVDEKHLENLDLPFEYQQDLSMARHGHDPNGYSRTNSEEHLMFQLYSRGMIDKYYEKIAEAGMHVALPLGLGVEVLNPVNWLFGSMTPIYTTVKAISKSTGMSIKAVNLMLKAEGIAAGKSGLIAVKNIKRGSPFFKNVMTATKPRMKSLFGHEVMAGFGAATTDATLRLYGGYGAYTEEDVLVDILFDTVFDMGIQSVIRAGRRVGHSLRLDEMDVVYGLDPEAPVSRLLTSDADPRTKRSPIGTGPSGQPFIVPVLNRNMGPAQLQDYGTTKSVVRDSDIPEPDQIVDGDVLMYTSKGVGVEAKERAEQAAATIRQTAVDQDADVSVTVEETLGGAAYSVRVVKNAEVVREVDVTTVPKAEAPPVRTPAAKAVEVEPDALAAQGIALSNLHPDIFAEVVAERMSIKRGVIIGRSLPNHADQKGLMDGLKSMKGKVSDDELAEMVRLVNAAPRVRETTASLFGDDTNEINLFAMKAQLSNWIRKKIAGEKRLFKFVSKEQRAKLLAEADAAQVNVEKAGKLSDEAAVVAYPYDRLSGSVGDVSRILNEQTERLSKGESKQKVRSDAYKQIREVLKRETEILEQGAKVENLVGGVKGDEGRPRGAGEGGEPAGRVASQADRSTGLRSDYDAKGLGHTKFASQIDALVEDSTIDGASADIALEMTLGMNDGMVSSIIIKSAKKIVDEAGVERAAVAEIKDGIPTIIIRRGLKDAVKNEQGADLHPAAIIAEEVAHITWALLTPEQRAIAVADYESQTTGNWFNWFKEGLANGDEKSAWYAANSVEEFYARAMSEWWFGRAPENISNGLRAIFEKMTGALKKAVQNLRKRGGIGGDMEELFDFILTGKQKGEVDEGPMMFGRAISKVNQDELGFVSTLETFINEKIPNPMSAKRIISTLKNSAVTKDELKWTGLDEFLESKGDSKITPEELRDYMSQRRVHIEEITLSDVVESTELADAVVLADRIRAELNTLIETDLLEHGTVPFDNITHVIQSHLAVMEPERNASTRDYIVNVIPEHIKRYNKPAYTEGYKNLLDNPDFVDTAVRYIDAVSEHRRIRADWGGGQAGYARLTLPGGTNYREVLLTIPRVGGSLVSEHYHGKENILSATRLDDRAVVGEPGKKAMAIQETQSDWHQQGAKHGYEDDLVIWSTGKDGSSFTLGKSPYGESGVFRVTKEGELWELHFELDETGTHHQIGLYKTLDNAKDWVVDDLKGNRPPPAPFKDSWHKMTFRRMLRLAVEGGYDYLAWPSTAKQVAEIERWPDLTQRADGKYFVGDGSENVTPIIERYLDILPKYAKKYGKQWGATLEKIKVETRTARAMDPDYEIRPSNDPEYTHDVVVRETGEVVDRVDLAEGEDIGHYTGVAAQKQESEPFNAVPITDAMKESVPQGQRMFGRALKPNEVPAEASMPAKAKTFVQKMRTPFESVLDATNPKFRIQSSMSHFTRMAAQMLRPLAPTKGDMDGTMPQRVAWETGFYQTEHSKYRVAAAVSRATKNVHKASDEKMAKKWLENIITAGLNQRSSSKQLLWQLIDQTAGEIAMYRNLGATDKMVKSMMTKRIKERFDTDVELRERGFHEIHKPEKIIKESIGAAKGFSNSAFDLNNASLTITTRIDDGDLNTPVLRSLLTELGDQDSIMRLDEAVRVVEEEGGNPQIVHNTRLDLIHTINEKRMSPKSVFWETTDMLKKMADEEGTELTHEEILRGLWTSYDPELGTKMKPEVAALIQSATELGMIDDFAFRGYLTPSFTKTINLDADRFSNASLRKSLKQTYIWSGIEPLEIFDSDTMPITQMLDVVSQDMKDRLGQFGVIYGTPEYKRATRDINDWQATIQNTMGLRQKDLTIGDRVGNIIMTTSAVMFLPVSALAGKIEVPQFVYSIGVDTVVKSIPRYFNFQKHLAAMIEANPEFEVAIRSMIDQWPSLQNQMDELGLLRMGNTPLRIKAMKDQGNLFSERILAMIQALTSHAQQTVVMGKPPVLRDVPVGKDVIRLLTLGGDEDIKQGVATLGWVANLWDALPILRDLENGTITMEQARAGGFLDTVFGDTGNIGSFDALKQAHLHKKLGSDDFVYLAKFYDTGQEIVGRFKRGEITANQMNTELLEAGIFNMGGTFIPFEKSGIQNPVIERYHAFVGEMARNFSSTVPGEGQVPLIVQNNVWAAMFFQFLSHVTTIASGAGFIGQMGHLNHRKQAMMVSTMLGAALFDRSMRMWLRYGFEEGSNQMEEMIRENPATFAADIIGRSSFFGLYEYLMRPAGAFVDGLAFGGDPYKVGKQVEYSLAPPALTALRVLTQGLSTIAMRPFREFSDADLRNIEQMTVLRRTLTWQLIEGALMGHDVEDAAQASKQLGQVKKSNAYQRRNKKLVKTSDWTKARHQRYIDDWGGNDALKKAQQEQDRTIKEAADAANKAIGASP